eukprot:495351-Pyramimonas_sp.AAC.1
MDASIEIAWAHGFADGPNLTSTTQPDKILREKTGTLDPKWLRTPTLYQPVAWQQADFTGSISRRPLQGAP